MALSRLLFLVILASLASLISAATSDTTSSQIRNFRYVQINIVDTANTTTNTFLPQLNGTVINLAENDMCTTPVFAAACNRTNNVDLLLRSTSSGTGTTKNISVLSIFQCISIWGPARCGYDDGYTRVTYNQPQSTVAPDTYTVHVLTQHFGCSCSTYRPAPVTSLSITSIRLSPKSENLTIVFSAPIAASTLQPYGTSVPLNTLFTSAGIARLGTNATAQWMNATTLTIILGSNPALSDTAGLGLLSDTFFISNYPNIVLSGSLPPITTSDGITIGFTLDVLPETNPDVFCNNITFIITGIWPGNSSAIVLHVTNNANQHIIVNYILTSNGTNPNTTWFLTIPTTTWSIGTYSIHLVVTSPVLGPLTYQRDIDIWRSNSCQCSQPRPYYQCHDCANPATPCLNNGTCNVNPTLEKTTYTPINSTSRSICTCNNAYSGYVCQIPPPCGINATAQVCGPHGLTCTNSQDAVPVAICTCEQDWSGSRCNIMSEAWTYVTIRLLYNYSSITNTTQFSNAFANEMGTALNRNPALFVVKSLRPGSTIVEFGIQPDRNNSVPSRVIYNQFLTLFNSNSTNTTFTGPILSTLDRSFLPIVLFDCNIDGCRQPVESSNDRKWKLGVGLGVGLGGGLLCLFGICMYCIYGREHHHDTSTATGTKHKDIAYSTPATATSITTAASIPVTTIKQVHVPAGESHAIEMQKATDDVKETQDHRASVTTDGGEEGMKRSVVFHI